MDHENFHEVNLIRDAYDCIAMYDLLVDKLYVIDFSYHFLGITMCSISWHYFAKIVKYFTSFFKRSA